MISAVLADLQRGAGAYRHVLHGDAGSAAKLRQQVVEQPGVGGAGGGRHPHCLSLCGGGAQQGCQSENDALDHERDCTWASPPFFLIASNASDTLPRSPSHSPGSSPSSCSPCWSGVIRFRSSISLLSRWCCSKSAVRPSWRRL